MATEDANTKKESAIIHFPSISDFINGAPTVDDTYRQAAKNTLDVSFAAIRGIGALLFHVGTNNPDEFDGSNLLDVGWLLTEIAQIQESAHICLSDIDFKAKQVEELPPTQ